MTEDQKLIELLAEVEQAKQAWKDYLATDQYKLAQEVFKKEGVLNHAYRQAESAASHRRDYLNQKAKNDRVKVNLDAKRVTLREYILMPGSSGRFSDLKLTFKSGKEVEMNGISVKLSREAENHYAAANNIKYVSDSFYKIEEVKDLLENYDGVLGSPHWPRYKDSGRHKWNCTLDNIYVEVNHGEL